MQRATGWVPSSRTNTGPSPTMFFRRPGLGPHVPQTRPPLGSPRAAVPFSVERGTEISKGRYRSTAFPVAAPPRRPRIRAVAVPCRPRHVARPRGPQGGPRVAARRGRRAYSGPPPPANARQDRPRAVGGGPARPVAPLPRTTTPLNLPTSPPRASARPKGAGRLNIVNVKNPGVPRPGPEISGALEAILLRPARWF